jgi:hypothetical protein
MGTSHVQVDGGLQVRFSTSSDGSMRALQGQGSWHHKECRVVGKSGYSCSEVRSMSPKTETLGVTLWSNITICASLDMQAAQMQVKKFSSNKYKSHRHIPD